MQQNQQPMSPSKEAAQRIASICPKSLFCGFNIKPKPNGDSAKLPVSKKGSGVSADIDPTALIAASELPNAPDLGDYWGIVMHHPTFDPFGDLVLTILDLDTKRSDAPKDLRMKRLLDTAKEMGLLTERSHSKKGGHIIFLAKPDASLPPKIDLGNRQEIEIFGQPKSGGKSVMLTGDNLRGDLIELPMTVTEFFSKCGIKMEQAKPVKAPAPMPALRFADNDDMVRAAQALTYISLSEGDYQEWIDMGMALQAGFGEAGFTLWLNWSATQPGFKGESDCLIHWKSFKKTGGITVASLFHKAKQNGFNPSKKSYEKITGRDEFNHIVEKEKQKQLDPETGEIFPVIDEPKEPEVIGWDEVDFDVNTLDPIDFLVDGFVAHSFAVIAGQPGVGKTTALLSVALVAAGFSIGTSPLKCEARRKIIYVSEDTAQIRRSLYAYCAHFGVDANEIKKWFVLIEAQRSSAKQVLVLANNVVRHTVNGERPWLIIDTANATLDIENENDNSQVGKFMSEIKQTIYVQLETSVAIVTHTSKTISREDDSAMARGASAFTGDATLTAVLFQDEAKNRYMKLVKTRYEPTIHEVRFDTHIYTKAVVNRHGNLQDLNCVIVVPEISSEQIRVQLKEEIKDQKKAQKIIDQADEIHSRIVALINDNPQGVVIKLGAGGSHIPPEALANYKILNWKDDIKDMGIKIHSDSMAEVKKAVLDRFAKVEVAPSWFKL